MPGFVDSAIINGKVQQIVWMPSLYPPRRSADESERDWGVVKSLEGFPCGPVGLVHTQNFGIEFEKPTCVSCVTRETVAIDPERTLIAEERPRQRGFEYGLRAGDAELNRCHLRRAKVGS